MAQHLTLTATQITDYYPADFISRLGKRLAALSAIRPPTDFQNAA